MTFASTKASEAVHGLDATVERLHDAYNRQGILYRELNAGVREQGGQGSRVVCRTETTGYY